MWSSGKDELEARTASDERVGSDAMMESGSNLWCGRGCLRVRNKACD